MHSVCHQILREINFGECKSYKIAIFAIFGALNLVDLVIFSLQNVQNCVKIAGFILP